MDEKIFKEFLYCGMDGNIYFMMDGVKVLIYQGFSFYENENGPFADLKVSSFRNGKFFLVEIPLSPETSTDDKLFKTFVFKIQNSKPVLVKEFENLEVRILDDNIILMNTDDIYELEIYYLDEDFNMDKILTQRMEGFSINFLCLYKEDVSKKVKRFYELVKGVHPLDALLYSIDIETKEVVILNELVKKYVNLA